MTGGLRRGNARIGIQIVHVACADVEHDRALRILRVQHIERCALRHRGNPGTNQHDSARGCRRPDPSTMVRLIDQLVERGWAVRETAEHDRRNTVPRITDAGSATLERIVPATGERRARSDLAHT